jgi:uncharacterized RDD family membrane protein YckC
MSDLDAPDAAAQPANQVSTIPVEARPYQGLRAGIVTRVLANLIDVAVVTLVLVSGYVGWMAIRFLRGPTEFTLPPVSPLVTVILIGLWVQGLYFGLAWMTTGRTYGDHVMGLRVVNARGRRLRPWGAAARAAFCVAFPIGLFFVVVNRKNRSVQDVVLRTSVIYDWTVRMESKEQTEA